MKGTNLVSTSLLICQRQFPAKLGRVNYEMSIVLTPFFLLRGMCRSAPRACPQRER